MVAGRRLFFAVWPEPPARHQLEALSGTLAAGWRLVPSPDLHLTVLFLGAVPHGLIPPLCAAADLIRMPAFEQPLARLESWAGGTLCCFAGDAVEALSTLHRDLVAAAVGAGLEVEKREFRPHVTLARAQRRAPVPVAPPLSTPLRFAAHALVLAESGGQGEGPRYRQLKVWTLADGVTGSFRTNG